MHVVLLLPAKAARNVEDTVDHKSKRTYLLGAKLPKKTHILPGKSS